MGDDRYLISNIILDASPLIYLAKLEALEVLSVAVRSACTTPAVVDEATRPQLAYRHPDAVEIEMALERGAIAVLDLTDQERMRARDIARQSRGSTPARQRCWQPPSPEACPRSSSSDERAESPERSARDSST